MKRYKTILWMLIAGLLPLTGFSQFNESREYNRKFSVLPDTRIEITNKYGNLVVNTWEKDSAVFKIQVNVEEKKLSRLEKTMEGIDFDFTESSHFLVVRTLVNQSKGVLEKELLKFKESLLQDDGSVEINYTIWLPASCDLIMENKFGNIFMSDFSGNCEIDLSNGNLKAHNLNGKSTINLNFADATINNMESARLVTNYSDVEIESAKQLHIDSKQSSFEMMKASELNITSRRDKFRVREAELVDAEGSFTSFRISKLLDRVNIRADYGDIDIEKIVPDFSLIFVEARNTDINLYFNPESSFGFELTKTKANTDLCREIEVSDETLLDEKEQKVKVSGKYGTAKPDDQRLFINATAGNVNIFSN